MATQHETYIAEIEREWLKLRLYFAPLDKFVSYQMKTLGATLDSALDRLIAHDNG